MFILNIGRIANIMGVVRNPCLILLLLILNGSIGAFSQSANLDSLEEQTARRPAYLNIAFGLNISNFRDFATSPLIYTGRPLYTSLSHIDMDEKRASHFMLSYSFGEYKTDFNEHSSQSQVNTVSLNYLELFELKKLSSSKANIKIGGQVNSTVNFRENSELFNNSEGVDIISTVFGSAQVTFDLSRKAEKQGRFLFIEYKANKRIRSLSYTLNVGLINSSYRNGFAYTSPSAPLNEDDFFAGYEFLIFSGFRMSSSLDYTIYLHNKNAIQFSYIWDAYRTSGHHDNFEMAAHILKFSLLFGLK